MKKYGSQNEMRTPNNVVHPTGETTILFMSGFTVIGVLTGMVALVRSVRRWVSSDNFHAEDQLAAEVPLAAEMPLVHRSVMEVLA